MKTVHMLNTEKGRLLAGFFPVTPNLITHEALWQYSNFIKVRAICDVGDIGLPNCNDPKSLA